MDLPQYILCNLTQFVHPDNVMREMHVIGGLPEMLSCSSISLDGAVAV